VKEGLIKSMECRYHEVENYLTGFDVNLQLKGLKSQGAEIFIGFDSDKNSLGYYLCKVKYGGKIGKESYNLIEFNQRGKQVWDRNLWKITGDFNQESAQEFIYQFGKWNKAKVLKFKSKVEQPKKGRKEVSLVR
jgi:hypothetical protein